MFIKNTKVLFLIVLLITLISFSHRIDKLQKNIEELKNHETLILLQLETEEKDIKKDIKKLSELFEAVSQIRKECEQIKVLENQSKYIFYISNFSF